MSVATVRSVFVLVVAKEPVPGKVKTRLCPPCSPAQAASLAEAALHDTFDAAIACGADEVIAALDGAPGAWLPEGVRIVAQPPLSFAQRLEAVWSATEGPGVQIGMDTPQVSAELLDDAIERLGETGTDAVLGPATDGGWWAIGLRRHQPGVFRGVPMSRPDTGRHQRRRLVELGLRVRPLPRLRDVDHFDDARSVAAAAPASRFAAAVRALELEGTHERVGR